MRPYFAYGSNMIVEDMRRRCPSACFLGVARLRGYRFRIARSGYASLAREPGAMAYGTLWSISAADEQRLDAYEEVATGLYRRTHLAVETFGAESGSSRRVGALVYLARDPGSGRPRGDYLERILAAARRHRLPGAALTDIERFLAD